MNELVHRRPQPHLTGVEAVVRGERFHVGHDEIGTAFVQRGHRRVELAEDGVAHEPDQRPRLHAEQRGAEWSEHGRHRIGSRSTTADGPGHRLCEVLEGAVVAARPTGSIDRMRYHPAAEIE